MVIRSGATLVAAFALVAILLSACGGDDGGDAAMTSECEATLLPLEGVTLSAGPELITLAVDDPSARTDSDEWYLSLSLQTPDREVEVDVRPGRNGAAKVTVHEFAERLEDIARKEGVIDPECGTYSVLTGSVSQRCRAEGVRVVRDQDGLGVWLPWECLPGMREVDVSVTYVDDPDAEPRSWPARGDEDARVRRPAS